MQQLLNQLLKRKISTQRVDDMASNVAVAALDTRVKHMLALHSTQPLPQARQFAALSNPIQNTANS